MRPVSNQIPAVFIHVRDLKKSVKWYSEIFGLHVDLDTVVSPVHNVPMKGGTGLTLDDHTFDDQFTHQPSPNPIANFLAADIDEAYEFLQQKNVKIVREIERIGKKFAWFNFSDPDGNVLMVCTC
ncbi:VOC family protein [Virgibacillus halophilus]|uniref:VOC family protein n=1 Tax=Tigheibacillus halophilus TaxID=361280 RepID=A0ABU5CC63_9BACI|nr:VOC family protein [Virgibacillus halophilus]